MLPFGEIGQNDTKKHVKTDFLTVNFIEMRLTTEEVLSKLPQNLSIKGIEITNQTGFDWIDLRKLHSIVEFVKSRFSKTKNITKRRNSYHLKHIVEQLIGFYVENGYLIAAMIIAGYEYKITGGSINTYHNVSFKSISKLSDEINNARR